MTARTIHVADHLDHDDASRSGDGLGNWLCDICGLVEHQPIPEDEAHCPCGGGLCECECHGSGI